MNEGLTSPLQRLSPDPRRRIAMGRIRRAAWRLAKGTFDALTRTERRKAHKRARAIHQALRELSKFPRYPNAPRHRLPGELVVSLTSYPGRYDTLHLTLKSLLDQSVRPDHVILWVAHEHEAQLPEEVTRLRGDLFTIRSWDDIRSFKKIIPALLSFPGAFVVIADDDTYYPADWLEQLVDAYDPADPTIVCHRAHQLTYTGAGRLAPYREWRRSVSGQDTHVPRTDLLPTGNGGVLYPPGSLPAQATDLELIRKLSATSDDVWLYFMWRLAGWRIKRVPRPMRKFLEWPDSQAESLRALHLTGKKDEHLQAMSDHFGTP